MMRPASVCPAVVGRLAIEPSTASQIADAGWSGVEWMNLTGGIVALHRAVNPGA